MKVISVEELEAISPSIYAEAVKAGCTHARVSEPIWRGPAHKGAEGEEMRMVEFSWFKAILRRDAVIFDETEPEKFLAVLKEYGLADVESMQPMRRHGAEAQTSENSLAGKPASVVSNGTPTATPAPPASTREAVTAFVLASTKARMEQQANEAGLSLGGLLDRMFGA